MPQLVVADTLRARRDRRVERGTDIGVSIHVPGALESATFVARRGHGSRWVIADEDDLARKVAHIALGQSRHVPSDCSISYPMGYRVAA